MVNTNDGLQNHVVYSGPHEVHIDSHGLKMLVEAVNGPFVPHVIYLSIHIVDKLFVFFIERKVGQVRIPVIGIVIAVDCESTQALVVHINSPRIHRCDSDVDSEIEFQPIYQEGVRHISADDTAFINRHL